jgi:hypothetical protein
MNNELHELINELVVKVNIHEARCEAQKRALAIVAVELQRCACTIQKAADVIATIATGVNTRGDTV